MTTKQLEYIIAISTLGSFRKAADSLYVSQPSLSMAVKSLEEEIGFPLFIRARNGVTITSDGAKVLEDSKQILKLIHHWSKAEDTSAAPVEVSVNAHGILASTVIPELLAEYEQKRSYIDIIHVDELIHLDLQPSEKSIVNLLFCEQRKFPALMTKAGQNGFQTRIICDEPTRVFINSNHPLARQSSVYLKDLHSFSGTTFDSTMLSLNPYAEFFDQLNRDNVVRMPNREAILETISRRTDVISHFSYVVAATSPYVKSGAVTTLTVEDYPMPTLLVAIYCNDTQHLLSGLLDQVEIIAHRLQKELSN